jgi:phosphoribosylanthranilate isomerase
VSLWVKVCGLRTAADVEATVTAGADAIGFVFAPSVRRVTPAEAAAAAAAAPAHVLKVAVFLHPAQAELDAVLAGFHPDLVQTDAADFANLRLPQAIGSLPVVRAGAMSRQDAMSHHEAMRPAAVLFEGPRSGSGQVADWTAAAAAASRTRLVLAGGLHAGNVAAAIAAVRPWGVDVSSGVERAPGVKDAALIRDFLNAARSPSGLHAAADR